MAEELLSTREIAEALGVQLGTVHAWAKRYSNVPRPRKKIGPTYLYRLSDWQKWYETPREDKK